MADTLSALWGFETSSKTPAPAPLLSLLMSTTAVEVMVKLSPVPERS